MSFPLVGNSKINLSITNAIREKRLPHAVLIEGDVGTGRHTLANFIANAAVCKSDAPPCGECNECRMFNNKSHPDIAVIAPEKDKKNIAVAQIREMRTQVFIKPHQAVCRVFLIDFADTMNEQSQNALLKILEEPPGANMFILIAESKASLLDTILSRCVTLTLSPPSKESAAEYIAGSYDFETDDISSALEQTHNNIGKALLLLKGKADSKTTAAAKEYLEYFLRNDSWGMVSTTAKFEKNRIEADKFFKDLKYAVAGRLRENPNSFSAPCLAKLYSEVCALEKSLASNINLSLLFAALAATGSEIISKS